MDKLFEISLFDSYREDNRREVKKASGGVPELFSVWKDQGWVEPIIKEEFDPDRTILIMKFLKRNIKEKVHKKRVRKKECAKKSAQKYS